MTAASTDGEPVVLVERRGGVLLVTINRPKQRNALDGAAGHALAGAMDTLDADDGLKAGVLTGAGGTFSAGMDLKAFLRGERPDLPGRGLGGITQTPMRKPLVAAVEGWALAGGFELLLACDLIVAAETARFGVPEVKRGLVAGGGAVLKLPRRIPYAVALEMLLLGEGPRALPRVLRCVDRRQDLLLPLPRDVGGPVHGLRRDLLGRGQR